MASNSVRRNCQDCPRADNFDNMVSCDDCHKWSHFRCVGVDSSIAKMNWICPRCKAGVKKKVLTKIPIPVKAKPKKKVDADINKLGKNVAKITVNGPLESVKTDSTASKIDANASKINVVEKKDSISADEFVNENVPKVEVSGPREEVKATFDFPTSLPCLSVEQLDALLLHIKGDKSSFIGFVKYIQSFCGQDIQKSMKKMLDNVMTKDVQKKVTWSGLRTTLPSLAMEYKSIVVAMNMAMQEKFRNYNYDMLEIKLKSLLGKK